MCVCTVHPITMATTVASFVARPMAARPVARKAMAGAPLKATASNGSSTVMRASWLPGSTPPAHLKGTLAGDFGAWPSLLLSGTFWVGCGLHGTAPRLRAVGVCGEATVDSEPSLSAGLGSLGGRRPGDRVIELTDILLREVPHMRIGVVEMRGQMSKSWVVIAAFRRILVAARCKLIAPNPNCPGPEG